MSKQDKPGYAEALAEIEAILAKFKSEDMDIDSLSADVRRASELIKICRERLRKAENEVASILEQE